MENMFVQESVAVEMGSCKGGSRWTKCDGACGVACTATCSGGCGAVCADNCVGFGQAMF
ncbi:MAG: hypothetical protein ACI4PK_01380 [Oscillospiraceae bacterium]